MERLRRIFLHSDVQALLLLAALTVLFLLPAVTMQGVYLYGDAGDSFARLSYGAERLRAGQLPLWDPYLSLGGTHAGDPLALTWYPPTLVLFGLLPEAVAYNYAFVLHLFLMAAGMYLLARSWQLARPGALVAALVFGFSGFVVAHLQNLNVIVALTWLPWIWLALEKYFTTRRAVNIGWGALALGLQLLGGQAQMVVYGACAWLAYAAVRWIREWRAREQGAVGKQVLAVGVMIAAGLGLAAIFLVPYFELVTFIDRTTYEYVTRFSLEAQRLIAFVYPFFFGGNSGSVERGAGSLLEMSAYVGILPLALSVVALARREWRVWLLWGLALAALVLAFGKYTPLYALWYYVPLLGSFDVPARWLGIVTFALALLAGLGMEQLQVQTRGRLLYVVLGGLALAVVLLGALLAAPRLGVRFPVLWGDAAANRALLVSTGLAAAALVVVGLWTLKILPVRWRNVLVVALVFAELFYFGTNFQYNFLGSYGFYTTAGKSARVILREKNRVNSFYWDVQEPSLISFIQRGDLKGYAVAARAGLRGSLPLRLKIHAMQGYGNEPRGYAELMREITQSGTFDVKTAQLLGTFGAQEILSATRLEHKDLQLVERNVGISLLRLKADKRRAFLTGAVVNAGDEAAARQILDAGVLAEGKTVIEGAQDDAATDPAAAGTVTIERDEPEHVTLAVETDAPAFVVLNDTFFPGWSARVDGNVVPLYRANGLVRAVAVAAGTHTVEFVYDPLAFKIGAIVSALTLVAVAGAMGWSARRR